MLLFGSHYLSLFAPFYLFRAFGSTMKPKGGFQSCLEIRQVPKCSCNCFSNVENNFFSTKTLTSPDNLLKWLHCLLVRTFLTNHLTLITNQNNFHLQFTCSFKFILFFKLDSKSKKKVNVIEGRFVTPWEPEKHELMWQITQPKWQSNCTQKCFNWA